eukprot:1142543-Pelagomonas_calceolata.AAC.2
MSQDWNDTKEVSMTGQTKRCALVTYHKIGMIIQRRLEEARGDDPCTRVAGQAKRYALKTY